MTQNESAARRVPRDINSVVSTVEVNPSEGGFFKVLTITLTDEGLADGKLAALREVMTISPYPEGHPNKSDREITPVGEKGLSVFAEPGEIKEVFQKLRSKGVISVPECGKLVADHCRSERRGER